MHVSHSTLDSEALRTFVAVHRHGGVTRAAEVLFRSQPAVSRRLTQLERELGVRLFERLPGGLALSDAGKVLLPFAETALATIDDATAAVHAVRTGDSGPVSLAIVGTLANTSLTPALRTFATEHPDIRLELRTHTSAGVSDLVRRAEATCGLRYGPDRSAELVSETLFTEPQTVIAHPSHRLARQIVANLSQLADESWLAFPGGPGTSETTQRLLDAAGVLESTIQRVDSLTAQKRLVEAGFGIALLPASSITEEVALGSLTTLDVAAPDLSVPVTLITRRNGFLSAAARSLIEQLRSSTSSS
jgi:DNA-binding transcriptional LysR family regulator